MYLNVFLMYFKNFIYELEVKKTKNMVVIVLDDILVT